MKKYITVIPSILFFFNNMILGMQSVENPHTLELAKPLTHVLGVLSSYKTLQRQVSMGYVEGIDIINNFHRRLLCHKYRVDPIRIECNNFLTFDDKSIYSKISYENNDHGVILVGDTYAMSGALYPSMLSQMSSNISRRTVIAVRKNLEHKVCADLTKKPILYELYEKNRFSHWITIENKVRIARLSFIEEYENTSFPIAQLWWEKYGNLPVIYLKIKKGEGKGREIPIHLMNAGFDEIKKGIEESKGFRIEVMNDSNCPQYFTICSVEIRDAGRMPNRGHFTYGVMLSERNNQKKEDTCMQRSNRFVTRFLYNHQNKIAATLIGLALLLLYKYHTFLFFGPHRALLM